MFKIVLLGGPG